MSPEAILPFPYGFVEEDWFRLKEKCFRDAVRPQYEALIRGLSAESTATIDMYLARLRRIPYQVPVTRACCDIGALLHADITPWDLQQLQEIYRFDYQTYYRMLHIPEGVPNVIPASYYHNGLKLLTPDQLSYVRGRDVIDGGAYLGESAFMFAQYRPRKVHAFEPDAERCRMMQGFFDKSIYPDMFEIVCAGLGETDGFATLNEGGAGSTMNCELQAASENDASDRLPVFSIDSYAGKHHLDIGCIKLDIEGLELETVRGAAETIVRCRPILLISIYHTAKDFFGVKPFIESLVEDYDFSVYHLDAREMLIEYMLIAVPRK